MDLLKTKKSARISPDRPSIATAAIVLVCLVMVASMAFSFAALHDAGAWTFNREWAYFLVPIFIDGAILAYTISFSIRRWRMETKEARNALRWLRFFTGFSSVVNGMHAASGWEWDYTRYEMWGGVAIAALAPVSALVSAEQIIGLVFQREHEDAVELDDRNAQQADACCTPIPAPVSKEPDSESPEQVDVAAAEVEVATSESLDADTAEQVEEQADVTAAEVEVPTSESLDTDTAEQAEEAPEQAAVVGEGPAPALVLVRSDGEPVDDPVIEPMLSDTVTPAPEPMLADEPTDDSWTHEPDLTTVEFEAPQLTIDGDGLFKLPTAS